MITTRSGIILLRVLVQRRSTENEQCISTLNVGVGVTYGVSHDCGLRRGFSVQSEVCVPSFLKLRVWYSESVVVGDECGGAR